jgi:hypothetical protein
MGNTFTLGATEVGRCPGWRRYLWKNVNDSLMTIDVGSTT